MKHYNNKRFKCHFTLLELLIVMGIISVLVALLLPALTRMKEIAKQTQCFNNEKHLGLALQMYTTDYTRFPLSWRRRERRTYYHFISTYLGKVSNNYFAPYGEIASCPSALPEIVPPARNALTYAAAIQFLSSWNLGPAGSATFVENQPSMQPSQVRNPTNDILLIETNQVDNGYGYANLEMWGAAWQCTTGQIGTQEQSVGNFLAAGHNTDTNNNSNINGGWPRWRHFKDQFASTLYFDLHVSAIKLGHMTREQTRQVGTGQWKPWN